MLVYFAERNIPIKRISGMNRNDIMYMLSGHRKCHKSSVYYYFDTDNY